jgi:hypothetical protein
MKVKVWRLTLINGDLRGFLVDTPEFSLEISHDLLSNSSTMNRVMWLSHIEVRYGHRRALFERW